MTRIQTLLGTAIAASVLGLAIIPSAHAQRTLSAASITIDDGAGHTMLIEPPQPGDAGYPLTSSFVWKIPVPPPGNPPAGFVYTGTSTNQTLLWDPLTGVQGSWRPSVAATLPTGIMHSTAGVVSSSAVALATADVSGILPVANGGTNANTAAGARASLSAAVLGANNDITSLSALSTPLSIGQGGTNSNTALAGNTIMRSTATGIVEGPAWNNGTATMTGNITGNASTAGSVTGIVPIANGGTNANNAAGARTNLGLGTLATQNSVDLTTNVGATVLPIANGGTNSNTALTGAKVMLSNNGATAIVEGPAWNSATSTITGNITGSAASATGNAATATALQTSRQINGVGFDGTANIVVPAAAGTLTGSSLAAGVTGSSLTSVGQLSGLSVAGSTFINKNANFSTEINDGTSTGNVFIGNAAGGVNLAGGVAINKNVNTNTELNTGTSTGAVFIGNAASSVVVNAPVQINKSVSTNTEINNGTSTGTLTLGNAAATVQLRSGTWGVTTAGAASFTSVSPTTLVGAGQGTGTTASNKYADHYTVDAMTTGVGTGTIMITNSLVTSTSVVVASIQYTAIGMNLIRVNNGAGTIGITGSANFTAGDTISYIIVN